jgi:hypothetical protein
MRHIDIAENFAQAARQAQERGEHGTAARLFAKALRVLHQWRTVSSEYPPSRRWADGRGEQVLSETMVPVPPSSVRR